MNRVGKLLIANPNFPTESPFYNSVIYIHQDDEYEGTTGLILNKPQGSVSRFCDHNGIMFPDTQPAIHYGGPVSETAIMMLHTDDWESNNTVDLRNGLRLSSDSHMFFKMSTGDTPIYWRTFYGMCMWRPGQLDKELAGEYPYIKNMWLTATPTEDVIFDYDGEDQWVKAVDLCGSQTIDYFF